MAEIEEDLREANSSFLGVLRAGGSNTSTAVAYNYYSNYFDGRFFTGISPPVIMQAVPFYAVINLKNGRLAISGSATTPLAILLHAQQINDN